MLDLTLMMVVGMPTLMIFLLAWEHNNGMD